MQKINPFLWFNNQAEEAAIFYTSIFKNSKIGNIARYSEEGAKASGRQKGTVMVVNFELEGQQFIALNGGPLFKFSPAISFFVSCETEEEINMLWKNLSEGGAVRMELNKYPFSEKFGWTQDKFGISWQLNLAIKKQKITPFLLYGNQAEEAIHFYTTLFKDSDIIRIERFGPDEREPVGTVKHAVFTFNGQEFMAMDNNKEHFTMATSLLANCETQEEVDKLWERLTDGGKESKCGWLEDKYGVTWQIVPTALGKLMSSPDPEKSRRVMKAMLQMKKLDIKVLQQAYDQK